MRLFRGRSRPTTGRPAGSYRAALTAEGAAGFFAAATVGRVGIAMSGLGIVWLVHWRTGSYGAAGVVAGAFAIAEAVLGPQVARLIDRYDQTRLLPPLLGAHAVAVAALVAMAVGGRPPAALVVAGALAGATIPQLGALSAARWSTLLRGHPALPAALTLERLAGDVSFLSGPALLGAASAVFSPVAGTVLAGLLVVAGGLALAAQPRTAPTPSPPPAGLRGTAGTLRTPGFAVIIGVNVGFGLLFGCFQVSVTAFVADHHVPELAGPLFSLNTAASLAAGLWYGARRWRASPATRLTLALGMLCVGCLLAVLAPGTPLLVGALVVSGAAIAPSLIVCAVLTQALVDRTVLTQAFTWTNSASAAGIAVAATVAGHAVDAAGPRWGFAIAAVAIATTAATVHAARTTLRTHDAGAVERTR